MFQPGGRGKSEIPQNEAITSRPRDHIHARTRRNRRDRGRFLSHGAAAGFRGAVAHTTIESASFVVSVKLDDESLATRREHRNGYDHADAAKTAHVIRKVLLRL